MRKQLLSFLLALPIMAVAAESPLTALSATGPEEKAAMPDAGPLHDLAITSRLPELYEKQLRQRVLDHVPYYSGIASQDLQQCVAKNFDFSFLVRNVEKALAANLTEHDVSVLQQFLASDIGAKLLSASGSRASAADSDVDGKLQATLAASPDLKHAVVGFLRAQMTLYQKSDISADMGEELALRVVHACHDQALKAVQDDARINIDDVASQEVTGEAPIPLPMAQDLLARSGYLEFSLKLLLVQSYLFAPLTPEMQTCIADNTPLATLAEKLAPELSPRLTYAQAENAFAFLDSLEGMSLARTIAIGDAKAADTAFSAATSKSAQAISGYKALADAYMGITQYSQGQKIARTVFSKVLFDSCASVFEDKIRTQVMTKMKGPKSSSISAANGSGQGANP